MSAPLPQQVINQLQALSKLGGCPWFDNNPLASEYILPGNWSPWDWIQFGGTSRQTAPQQFTLSTGGSVVSSQTGPYTFLAKVDGKYEVYIDKKTQVGKPAVNTALYAKQNEIKVKLYLVTPFDLICVRQLLEWACAIFPASIANPKTPKVIPIYHPKLDLFSRNAFILVSMTYVEEPRDGRPAYVDTVWIPQDAISPGQNQVGQFNIGVLATTPTAGVGQPVTVSAEASPPPIPSP